MKMKERELREKRARKFNKMASYQDRLEDGTITRAERVEFDKISGELHDLDRRIQLAQVSGVSDNVAMLNRDAVTRARGLQTRVAHDTSDLPTPDKPLEARHDIKAWYEQRSDYARYEGMPGGNRRAGIASTRSRSTGHC